MNKCSEYPLTFPYIFKQKGISHNDWHVNIEWSPYLWISKSAVYLVIRFSLPTLSEGLINFKTLCNIQIP